MPARSLYDVAIIGGGASGLAAALSAGRAGASTIVIERDVAAGLPILATGNGRCNISNRHLEPTRYRDEAAARTVLGAAPEAHLASFFSSIGLMTACEDDRLYPYSKRAESVRDALLAACMRAGVRVLCAAALTSASFLEGAWQLAVEAPDAPLTAPRKASGHARLRALRRAQKDARLTRRVIIARSVVIAVGGHSSAIAHAFRLPHRAEQPVLCPVACSLEDPRHRLDPVRAQQALDGVRHEVALELERDDAVLWRERGEVLFRPYGLSGIVAFNLSRRGKAGDTVRADLFPDYSADQLAHVLAARERQVGSRQTGGARWWDGIVVPALSAVIDALTADGDATHAARLCKALPFTYDGVADERAAQVRRGGVPLSAVDLETLAVPSADGPLFICGEALDQDADCGGFNLAWAWLSGLRAGESAAQAQPA